MKNVKYGKCVRCGKTYEAVPTLTNCTCGGILDIVYDYGYIKSVLSKEKLAARENRSMWRYRELLPVEECAVRDIIRRGTRVAPFKTERFDKSCTYREYIRLYEYMCGSAFQREK